jgi:uncharacterized protein YdhG (YjbR/CyaY superfamily)
MDTTITSVSQYIQAQPAIHRSKLEDMRRTILQAAPDAKEAIKYGMPTFVLQGNLVHFALCKNHIGFYPSPSGITNFEKELTAYVCSKGSIHFPLDQPIPEKLVKQIVGFRAKENQTKAAAKQARSKR